MSSLDEQLVSEEEGVSATVYPDSRGFLTIAAGCCVDKRVMGAGLCAAAIAAQLDHDLAQARKDAAAYSGFDAMNDVQRSVIVSMSFQMGRAPLHWPNFDAALAANDWAAARIAGLDTQWARQTPKRAQREMWMLAHGTWLAHGEPVPTEEGP